MKERDLYGHALSSTTFYISLYGEKKKAVMGATP